MIHAYDKIYLEKARTVLGRMLDFAVYDLKYKINDFFDLFIKSGLAERFESGDFEVIAGISGVELAYKTLEKCNIKNKRIKPKYTASRSPEFWAGWALAYYQWETSMSFKKITQQINIDDIVNLYHPYHEMDIRQFVDKMNEIYRKKDQKTNLKAMRQNAGLSQRELAELSNIPIRTIQQYEQRQKNINKAQIESLIKLSKTLCCKVEDLVEHII